MDNDNQPREVEWKEEAPDRSDDGPKEEEEEEEEAGVDQKEIPERTTPGSWRCKKVRQRL